LSVAQHPALARLRFLHLDDHLGPVEHGLRVADDLGTGRPVVFVEAPDPGARPGFDHNLVAVDGELTDAIGGQPDPILMNLDLLGNTDQHRFLRRASWARSEPSGGRRCHRKSRAREAVFPYTVTAGSGSRDVVMALAGSFVRTVRGLGHVHRTRRTIRTW
jgi:hypothetical protein